MNINYNKDMVEVVENFAVNNDFDIVKNYSKTLPTFTGKQTHYTKYHDWEHEIENKISDPLVIASMENIRESVVDYLKNSYLPNNNLKFLSLKHKHKDLEISRSTTGFVMHLHNDGFEVAQPFPYIFMSAVLYFNDDYNGGEINFPNHEIMLKPKTNNLIVFPSHFQHEVFKVLDKDVPFVHRTIMSFIFYFCVESLV